jgi:CRISPR-associated protein Cas1
LYSKEVSTTRIVLDGYGWYVGKKKNRIIIKKEGERVGQYSVKKIEQLVVNGKGAFSFDALWLLAEFGVPVLFLDWRGELVGKLVGREVGTVSTRREQYLAYFDERGGAGPGVCLRQDKKHGSFSRYSWKEQEKVWA